MKVYFNWVGEPMHSHDVDFEGETLAQLHKVYDRVVLLGEADSFLVRPMIEVQVWPESHYIVRAENDAVARGVCVKMACPHMPYTSTGIDSSVIEALLDMEV